MGLQVLQALLEPYPIRVPTRVLDFSVKVHCDLAVRDLVRSGNMIGQATIPSLQRDLPWLGRGQGHIGHLLLLHGILVLGARVEQLLVLRNWEDRLLILLADVGSACRLPVPLQRHEWRLAASVLLEDALL